MYPVAGIAPSPRPELAADALGDSALQLMRRLLPEAYAGVGTCRRALEEADRNLEERFRNGEPVGNLVRLRALVVDQLLTYLWRQHSAAIGDNGQDSVALVAVGGYGRGELHPSSDVDIMLLRDHSLPAGGEAAISARSEEHTSELQSRENLVCRLLLEKKKHN